MTKLSQMLAGKGVVERIAVYNQARRASAAKPPPARRIDPEDLTNLPKTKPVWQPLRPLKVSLMLGAAQEPARSDTFRHRPHEFGKFGRPVARADRGRILALARELNAQTRSPRRQGVLKATGLLVLETLMFRFANNYTGRMDPSLKTLARAAGVGIRTAARAVRRLKDAGLLSWRRRFNGSNRYAIGQSGSLTSGFKIDQGEESRAPLLYQACRALSLPESLILRYGLG